MKSVIKVVSIGLLALLSMTTNAATINGSFGVIGDLDITGADLSEFRRLLLNENVKKIELVIRKKQGFRTVNLEKELLLSK